MIGVTYVNENTGEIITPLDKINAQTDKATRASTNMDLTDEEVESLRATTNTLTGVQCTLGLVTGVLLGKTLFTIACISIGSTIIYDMVTPTDLICKKVLTFKNK